MKSVKGRSQALLSAALLVSLVLLVYWPVGGHDFISFDDPAYVFENPMVMGGLTWEGLRWAFNSFGYAGNSDPLTWLTHMLDVELFGMDAGSHHLVSLLFHILNTLLLAGLLEAMTGARRRSVMAAALFALHPLHVESVAWIAERKDVLSTFFWMLTMAAYLRYTRRPGVKRYFPVALLFALALLSKPMVVTLPLVFLLLDYWPLRRFGWGERAVPGEGTDSPHPASFRRLLAEKVPLLLLSAGYSALTYYSQVEGGAVISLQRIPLPVRAANALLSYVVYLGKTVLPRNLSIFYPHREALPPVWQIAAAAAALILVTALALLARRRAPYLVVGWFWYLGTLVPVIGITQIGWFSMADRFTYIPLIGIFFAAVWGAADIASGRVPARLAGAAAGVVLAACVVASAAQVRHWRNSLTLFGHALEVTTDNWVAEYHYGGALVRAGRADESEIHYRRSMELRSVDKGGPSAHSPGGAESAAAEPATGRGEQGGEGENERPLEAAAHLRRGHYLLGLGRFADAGVAYRRALEHRPELPEALNGLGTALFREGRREEAGEVFARVLRSSPGDFTALFNTAVLLEGEGRLAEAASRYRQALKVRPGDKTAGRRLEKVLLRQGGVPPSERAD